MTIHKKIWSDDYQKDNWDITNVSQEYMNTSGSPLVSNKNLKKVSSPVKLNDSMRVENDSGLVDKSKMHQKYMNDLKRRGMYTELIKNTTGHKSTKDLSRKNSRTPKSKKRNDAVKKYGNKS